MNTLELARKHHNNVWPEELWTGVMYFMGQRITRDEFEASGKGASMTPHEKAVQELVALYEGKIRHPHMVEITIAFTGLLAQVERETRAAVIAEVMPTVDWYADEKNWCDGDNTSPVEHDFGKRARELKRNLEGKND